MSQWFSVDKKGLAKLMEGRAKSFVLYELIQNAWDEASQLVSVSVQYVDGHRRAEIAVEDDNPEGFKDITHAYTLFAESTKKSDAEKRGRFNLGEKLVLAMSQRAWIETTKGIVIFDHAGRQTLRGKRAAGSLVKVEILMSKAEMGEILVAARRLIPPPNIKTTINGEILPCRVVHRASSDLDCGRGRRVATHTAQLHCSSVREATGRDGDALRDGNPRRGDRRQVPR
jgi:hypothetical protein